MALSAENKTEIISEYRRDDKDSGSPEVQVALLTTRINELTEHMKAHRHDFASRRGLLMMVARRRGLLNYLKNGDFQRYKTILGSLGLRK